MPTIMIILEQIFLYLPLVLGAYISLSLIKVPDISLEAAFVFGSIVGARTLVATQSMPFLLSAILVLSASVAGGMLVGLCSSLLTQKGRFAHLLSSILTIGLFHGINQYVIGGANLPISSFRNILIINPNHYYPELATMIILGTILIILCTLLTYAQLGYSFAIYGNNPHFFKHYRISSRYIFMSGILLANGLAGLSGYFVAQTSGFIDINAGFGMVLLCITTLILGKTALPSRPPLSMRVPILGISIFCCLQQLLLKGGFNLKYFTMIQSAIIVMVLIYRLSKERTAHHDNLGV